MPLPKFAAELIPFATSSFQIHATMSSTDAIVSVSFRVTGPLDRIKNLAAANQGHGFCHELWRSTCFELFLLSGDQYLEWNFASSGAYACYHFSGSRHLIGEVRSVKPLINCRSEPGHFELQVKLRWPAILRRNAPAKLQLSAILDTDEGLSYYALRHRPATPDFHWLPSFTSFPPGDAALS